MGYIVTDSKREETGWQYINPICNKLVDDILVTQIQCSIRARTLVLEVRNGRPEQYLISIKNQEGNDDV
jgi:hypothetical protein